MNFIMSRWSDMSSIIQFYLWILLCLDEVICQVLCLDEWILFWIHVRILFYFEVLLNMSDACCCCFNIRPTMVSKHSELEKRQAQDHYGRFAFSSSCTAPPPSHHQEVGSSSHRSSFICRLKCTDVGGASSSSDMSRRLLLDLIGVQRWMPSR
jgi:hypothetical protein